MARSTTGPAAPSARAAGAGKLERDTGYAHERRIRAPRERVFDAVATPEGLRGWWAADVQGTAAVGDVVRLGFALPTHDEWIVMRVDRRHRPEEIAWACVAQYVAPQGLTRHDEWVGTSLTFRIAEAGAGECVLHFEHAGLTPGLECYGVCARGWDYFLTSLARYAETGEGTPFDRG